MFVTDKVCEMRAIQWNLNVIRRFKGQKQREIINPTCFGGKITN